MTFDFAEGLPETEFKDLNEALAFMDGQPTRDTIVSTGDLSLTA